jgi:hypothetical protein
VFKSTELSYNMNIQHVINKFACEHTCESYKAILHCEITSSHVGEYEAQNLLGCTAMFLTECRPTFQRCVLPPSSGR